VAMARTDTGPDGGRRQVVRRPPFGANPVVGERGSDTRRRVLAAALEVFGEVGFPDARVESITERAGCSRPAFYQYFAAKDDVFWELAGQLGTEMVALAKRLGPVGPDAAGLARLERWVADFMALHAAWAPVFDAYPAAARDHRPAGQRSIVVSDRMGLALLRAFGATEDAANRRLASGLVAVLIRCSFYAEHATADLEGRPLAEGVAAVVHRTFAGPVDGVNVLRGMPSAPMPLAAAPEASTDERNLRPRGERTRVRLLGAGASVLPVRGYQDTRVDDVVAAAGVSHGTFYRYFENRDDFFRVLCEAASTRMMELLDRLDIAAPADELRAWVDDWFTAYEADGGVISTWPEMQTGTPLDDLARAAGVAAYTRLARALAGRDFGDPAVDATTLFALLERLPYSVATLGFSRRDEAIASTVTAIRRGFVGIPA
jgi:AcrR family transcriptional regulator